LQVRPPRLKIDRSGGWRMKALAAVLALLLAPLACGPAGAAECVGFEFVQGRDLARSFSVDGRLLSYRPVDFAIWSQAACRGADVSTGRLIASAAIQRGMSQAEAGSEAGLKSLIGGEPAPNALSLARGGPRLVEARGGGRRSARPLVIYVHASAVEADPMARALADAGFVVAALTWRGTFSQELDVAASGMVTEVQDAQFVLGEVARRGLADTSKVYVIGTSFGALTALCWAQQEPRVRKIVSLDGGIATPTADVLSPRCPYFHASQPDARLLHLYDASYDKVTFEMLRRLTRLKLEATPVPTLQHRDYSGTTLLRAEGEGAPYAVRSAAFGQMVAKAVDFLRRDGTTPDPIRR
jgi:dienelactone hydrolase